MKILLESTSAFVTLDTPDGSVPARLWEGTTASGVPLHAYVVRVFANNLDHAAELEGEMLTEQREPSPQVLALVTERGDSE